MVGWEFLRGVWRRRREGQKLSFVNRRKIRYPKEPWVSKQLADDVEELERSYSQDRVSASIYASLIRRCIQEGAFSYGVRVHRHMDATKYLKDTFMGNLLIKFYGRCGHVEWARDVFEAMYKRNAFTWNTFLGLLEENDLPDKVYRTFLRMRIEGGVADCKSYTYAVRACGELCYFQEGRMFHYELMDKRIPQDHVFQSALIYMYARCNRLDVAMKVFRDVRFKEPAAWNAIILAVYRRKAYEKARELFSEMLQEGKRPDKTTYFIMLDLCLRTGRLAEGRDLSDRIVLEGLDKIGSRKLEHALVRLYARCHLFREAREVLDRIPSWNKFLWNSCIAIYVEEGCYEEALELYQTMRRTKRIPDASTFQAVLGACCHPQYLKQGKAIYARVVATVPRQEGNLVSAIIKMFSDCGSIRDAKVVFDKRKTKKLGPWNALLAAYLQHGLNDDCLQLYRVLHSDKVVTANDSAFITAIAAASTEETRVQGNWLLSVFAIAKQKLSVSMQRDVLNMFAMCGEVENAQLAFDQMSVRDALTWNTLALAYARGGSSEKLPELIQNIHLEGFEPDHDSLYFHSFRETENG